MSNPIDNNPFNTLTNKEGEHPTAGTPALDDTPVVIVPAPTPMPIVAPTPTIPSKPLAIYEVFNIFMDDQKSMLASDAIKIFGDLQLEPYDEFFFGVRRAPKE